MYNLSSNKKMCDLCEEKLKSKKIFAFMKFKKK